MHCNGKWIQNIKRIADSVDKLEHINSKSIIPIAQLKSDLMHTYEQSWKESISQQSKLKNYCEIKENFNVSSHVSVKPYKTQKIFNW